MAKEYQSKILNPLRQYWQILTLLTCYNPGDKL